ncbi:hypothetical protein HRbin40_01307 [bacterium HR40]|nr:hypothetical protein HRbin40_01307 [bacterium HR40]
MRTLWLLRQRYRRQAWIAATAGAGAAATGIGMAWWQAVSSGQGPRPSFYLFGVALVALAGYVPWRLVRARWRRVRREYP